MRRGVIFRISVVVATLLVGSSVYAAGKGLLSIKCDGSPAETRFIADQQGTEIKDGMRTITADAGFVIYRFQVDGSTLERFYYSVGAAPYSLEFSPDGRKWSTMVTIPTADGWPDDIGRSSVGFSPDWQKTVKETHLAYFRFSRLADSKAPLYLQSIDFEVSGASFPAGFRSLPKDFDTSSLTKQHKRSWPITTFLMVLVGLLSIRLIKLIWKPFLRLFGPGKQP